MSSNAEGIQKFVPIFVLNTLWSDAGDLLKLGLLSNIFIFDTQLPGL